MRLYNRVLMIISLTGLILSGCSKDDDAKPSAEAKQLTKLSGTWVVSSVTVDGGDKTSEYSSFEMTLSGTANAAAYAYGVVGRPLLSPWPSDGTWIFGSDIERGLVRDPGTADQLQMDYTVTDNQLRVEFLFNGTGYDASSRVNSAAGEWVFVFSRQ